LQRFLPDILTGIRSEKSMIKINGLCKSYGKYQILENINLSVPKGVILGLIGPNGAGKTTLVSVLIGIVKKDRGDIFIADLNIDKELKQIQAKSSIVPQTLAFYPMLTAYENLEYFGSLYGFKGKRLKQRIDFSVEMSGLSDFMNKKAEEFSGGMGRRLNLAVGLLNDPEILYLDEPTVGVDAQARNYILEMIKKINQERKTTVIYTSHYMEEIEKISDIISIIDHGKIILCDKKELLLREDKDIIICFEQSDKAVRDKIRKIKGIYIDHHFVKIKKDAEFYTNMIRVLSLLKENKIRIKDIKSDSKNLEELFFHLTSRHLRDI